MKKIFIPIIMTLLLASLVIAPAVVTITTPADDEEIQMNAAYNVTGTLTGVDGGGENGSLNCSAYDGLRNVAMSVITFSNTTPSTNVNTSSGYWGEFTPTVFGTHNFTVRCTNSTLDTYNATTIQVKYRQYEAAEISEVTIDMIVGVIAIFVSLVSLIGLILLWKWLKKSGVRIG